MTTEWYGQLRSVEDLLFSIEERNDPNRARQTLLVRKIDEKLRLSFRLFNFRGLCLILDSQFFFKRVQNTSFGQKLKPKERNKLLRDCQNISVLTHSKLWSLLKMLERDRVLASVIGTDIGGHRFHFIRDPNRFRHCLGLADAVDLAMRNVGVSVRFQTRAVVTINSHNHDVDRDWKCRLYSRRGRKAFTKSIKTFTSKRRVYLLLLHYLRSIPYKEEEKDYVKMIKVTLAKKFSEQMEQELPQGETFPLFPEYAQAKLDNVLKNNKRARVHFYFNLLQSKALCAPVGEDMIKEAYVKHRESLCRPQADLLVVPEEHLTNLFEYGKMVGKRLKEIYNPSKTTLPNGRACIEKGRHLGGNYSQLKENLNLQLFSNHPICHIDQTVRLEPYVIGLFGPPGSGKTTMVQTLVQFLQKEFFPDMNREQLLYARSCSVEHWDGYRGQPIVIFDDFGQNHCSRIDVVEFENVVSVNDYVLPMAELSEKGQKFVSPIIILTSNCRFGSDLRSNNSTHVEEPWAVWRRITLPLLVEKGKMYEIKHKYSQEQELIWRNKHHSNDARLSSCVPWDRANINTNVFNYDRIPGSMYHLCKRILGEIDERYKYHQRNLQGVWVQSISRKRIECFPSGHEPLLWDVFVNDIDIPCSDHDWSLDLQFPSSPPASSPVVKAVALPEPLKVRMITAAESVTKVLQPFQKALWQYLSEQPQFCLTNGVKAPWSEHETFADDTLPWIYRIETMIKEIRDRTPLESLWLSGDYTAATDNFPMSVTNALVEGILSEIEHQPTRDWVRWECSSHRILYPNGVEGMQTSGQLMGSLLSFPLLCFLNDYIVSSSGFPQFSYLINGDDVVARGSEENIQKWRANAPQVGLSLSIGKNFVDPDFCTVNSQLFYQGEVLHTGKVSCQTRVGASLAYCFEETQFYWGPYDWVKYEFLKRNLLELRKTPRSLHLSKKLGGLGLVNSLSDIRYDHGLMKEVYIYDLLRSFDRSINLPGTSIRAVPVPVLRGTKAKEEMKLYGKSVMDKILSLTSSLDDLRTSVDLTHSDLSRFRRKVHDFPQKTKDHIHSIIKNGKYFIQDFPPLDFLEIDYVFIQEGKSRFVLERARQHCLDLFEYYLSQDQVHPLEWIGGDISDLPGLSDHWKSIKEIFLDKNLLTEEPFCLDDLDLTEDVANWFNELSEEELKFPGSGSYFPLPTDTTPIIEFLSLFSYETDMNQFDEQKNNHEQNSDLPV